MVDAAKRFDLDDPAMKASAVHDVLAHVAKIQDRIEQLEVARSVAEGFKMPESLILDRLKLTPRRPDVRPVARTTAAVPAGKKLTVAEKQLIQALLQGRPLGPALAPLLESDVAGTIWSRPVLQHLVKNPEQSIETTLANVEDEALRSEIRAAVLEPVGSISDDQALDSVKQLYDLRLVQKLEEIRQELHQYGAGPAPAELVRKHMEIVAERTRVAAFKG